MQRQSVGSPCHTLIFPLQAARACALVRAGHRGPGLEIVEELVVRAALVYSLLTRPVVTVLICDLTCAAPESHRFTADWHHRIHISRRGRATTTRKGMLPPGV